MIACRLYSASLVLPLSAPMMIVAPLRRTLVPTSLGQSIRLGPHLTSQQLSNNTINLSHLPTTNDTELKSIPQTRLSFWTK